MGKNDYVKPRQSAGMGGTNPGVVETVAFSAPISRRLRVLLRLGALWLILVPLDLRTEIHTPHNAAV
jgi:hypothetical protein